MLTTFEISWSLSVGTLSQRLKASMSFVRISLLGEEVIYVNGSRIAWGDDGDYWCELRGYNAHLFLFVGPYGIN